MVARLLVIGALVVVLGLSGVLGDPVRTEVVGGVLLLAGGVVWFLRNRRGLPVGRGRGGDR